MGTTETAGRRPARVGTSTTTFTPALATESADALAVNKSTAETLIFGGRKVRVITKRPLESHDVEGLDGPDYELNILCSAPGCVERSNDRHHLWRRSFLGGPYSWVILPDDSHVGNVVGLCRPHHEQVDRNQAAILWEGERFMWDDLAGVVQPLAFQPPHTLGDAASPLVDPEDVFLPRTMALDHELHVHAPLDNACPTCHQPLPKPKVDKPLEEKKVRRTFSITIPMDQRENGAEVLTTLLEEGRLELARAGMSYGAESVAKYHVMATILALFVQHARSLLAEV